MFSIVRILFTAFKGKNNSSKILLDYIKCENKLYLTNSYKTSIKEFKYWTVCVRKKHLTLRDAVILLKREVLSASQMIPQETAEFPKVLKWYKDVCTKKIGAVRFNYMIIMMKDFFVHYHAFLRYDKTVHFLEQTGMIKIILDHLILRKVLF